MSYAYIHIHAFKALDAEICSPW